MKLYRLVLQVIIEDMELIRFPPALLLFASHLNAWPAGKPAVASIGATPQAVEEHFKSMRAKRDDIALRVNELISALKPDEQVEPFSQNSVTAVFKHVLMCVCGFGPELIKAFMNFAQKAGKKDRLLAGAMFTTEGKRRVEKAAGKGKELCAVAY